MKINGYGFIAFAHGFESKTDPYLLAISLNLFAFAHKRLIFQTLSKNYRDHIPIKREDFQTVSHLYVNKTEIVD